MFVISLFPRSTAHVSYLLLVEFQAIQVVTIETELVAG